MWHARAPGGAGDALAHEITMLDAVALVRSSGKTVTEVAWEIRVSAKGLRNWEDRPQPVHVLRVRHGPLGQNDEADAGLVGT
ncbi:hypothetical protein ACFY2M_44090 [Streptomyces sp. NPDC001276]|uniref:hypothetical protein n=1 Tax=Streptomyces sp. NPDC001276 TaxID=3364555 RepID=UPI0036A4C80E